MLPINEYLNFTYMPRVAALISAVILFPSFLEDGFMIAVFGSVVYFFLIWAFLALVQEIFKLWLGDRSFFKKFIGTLLLLCIIFPLFFMLALGQIGS